MSSTTTTMFAPRIWGFDRNDPELRAAREAGWSRTDLAWERLSEAALEDWAAGRPAPARRRFKLALWIARLAFAADDPRLATAHANVALILAARGKIGAAERHQRKALAIWQGVGAAIERMEIRPRSRSSLFHLRMELRHRGTFHDNLRLRISRIAAETEATLRTLTGATGAGHRHHARWRGERPVVFDDTRKVLSACLLIIDRG